MASIFDKVLDTLGFSSEKPNAGAEQNTGNSARDNAVLELAKKTIPPEHLQKIKTTLNELDIPEEKHAQALVELNTNGVMATKNAQGNDVSYREFNSKLDTDTKRANEQFSVALGKDKNISKQVAQTDHVTEQVAKQVKEFNSRFNLGIDPDDKAEHTRIAKELIEARQMTTKDGIVLKISTLDKMISDNPKDKADFEEKFGKGATLESIIPTAPKRDAINAAINNAEKENSGMFGVGFMNAFMGLLSWIFSGFSGGMTGLKESIATTTANSMAQDTEKHLAASKILTPEEISRVKEAVHTTTLEKAGITVAKKDTVTATEQTAAPASPAPKQETVEIDKSKNDPSISAGKEQKQGEQQSKGDTKKDVKNKEEPEKKTPVEKKEPLKENPPPTGKRTVVVERKHDDEPKPTKTTNLEKSANNLIDNFLSKNKQFVLEPEQIAAIKTAVNKALVQNKDEGALSNPSYDGNYQVISGKIAEAILKDAGLSQHELLQDTPYHKQHDIFTKKIQESLASGDGKKIREASLKDKAQQSASMIDLKGLGINYADASALGIYRQKQVATAIS